MKVDSRFTANTKLDVFHAAHHGSFVRYESDDMFSGVLHIFDGKQHAQIRVTATTMACIAEVARLYEANEEKQGVRDEP